MLRRFAAAAAAFVLVAGLVVAADYKGAITAVDTDGKTVKVKVGDEEKVLKYNDKTEFVGTPKDPAATVKIEGISKRLEKAKKGIRAEIVTEGDGAKEVIKTVTFKYKKKN